MRILRLPSLFLLFAVTTSHAQSTFTNNPEAWRADLRFLASELPRRHVNFYNTVSPFTFAQAVSELDANIPVKTDAEIHLGLLRLAAMARDGHTSVGLTASGLVPFFRRFPLYIQWLKDGWYLTNVSYQPEPISRGGKTIYRRLLGTRLVKIGDTPVEEATQRLSQLISYENEYWLRVRLQYFLLMPEALLETGVVTSMENIALTFAQADGQEITIRPPLVSWNSPISWTPNISRKELPLYRQNTSANYWYKILDDGRTLWLQYNRCADAAGNPMSSFAAEMFRTADASGVTRFVIDLRNNTGGNSTVINPVINALVQRPWLNQRGRVYVITGNVTYSGGLWCAVDFRNRTRAILLGEPTGGKPNSYGEVVGGVLANSRLSYQYSTKLHNLVPGNPSAIFPDVLIELTAADYINNNDPVLSYILTQ